MIRKTTPPLLAVSELRIERGTTAILRGIEWQVRAGEQWVVLGPNGCGKTSLLRALTGYMPPTTGTISVFGKTYGKSDWRSLRTRIGLVASALQMSIPLSEPAIETVISGKFAQLDLWAKTTPRERADALELLRLLGAAQLAEREWVHLSQGERQRVLIARALMARPKLLILDEPCAGLDPIARERFLRQIDQLARRRGGPRLVLVTHHVEEITPAFTHALVLRAGRVVAAGPRSKTLTSATLSAAFGARVRLKDRNGTLRLDVPRSTRIRRA